MTDVILPELKTKLLHSIYALQWSAQTHQPAMFFLYSSLPASNDVKHFEDFKKRWYSLWFFALLYSIPLCIPQHVLLRLPF